MRSRYFFPPSSPSQTHQVVARFFAVPPLWLGVSTFPLTQVRADFTAGDTVDQTPLLLVVIKGTQVYDSSKGQFADLSILDVLQVFGRAGRPGLESSGEGYICTTEDRLSHFLDKVTSQVCTLASPTV